MHGCNIIYIYPARMCKGGKVIGSVIVVIVVVIVVVISTKIAKSLKVEA